MPNHEWYDFLVYYGGTLYEITIAVDRESGEVTSVKVSDGRGMTVSLDILLGGIGALDFSMSDITKGVLLATDTTASVVFNTLMDLTSSVIEHGHVVKATRTWFDEDARRHVEEL